MQVTSLSGINTELISNVRVGEMEGRPNLLPEMWGTILWNRVGLGYNVMKGTEYFVSL
jgi:hypothetical protein